MKCQLLIAQLTVLLEQGAAQHRLRRQAMPSGLFDPVPAKIFGHQAQQLEMLIQPTRHGLQLAADLVSSEQIEYAGLDGAFLTHLSAPAVAGRSLESVALPCSPFGGGLS